ncbi:hypothetical protein AA0X95_08485 [Bacillus sp. 1P10SD]|uniref:hypothetical protein n=1 Tax=Bacillus sp. 1P10SD TaxID=3132265 RepID=UPI0039A6F981
MSGKDFLLSSPNIHSKNDLCFVWRNIYNLKLIKEKNIRFNEQVFIGEDVIFNLEVFLKSKRLIAVPEYLYFYRVNNPDSLMRSTYKPNLENSLIIQYQVRKRLSIEYGLLDSKHFRKDMAYYYINNIFKLIKHNLKSVGIEKINISLRRIVNNEMIADSLKEIGLFYKCENIKEYIYYMALRLKIYPLLLQEFSKIPIKKGGR